MPLLQPQELSGYISKTYADMITKDANSFTMAEKAVSDVVHRKTGITIPDDASNAPDWAKEAAAYLILYRRIGVIINPSPAFVSWAHNMHKQAMDSLSEHKEATPTGRTGAETGELEGILKW